MVWLWRMKNSSKKTTNLYPIREEDAGLNRSVSDKANQLLANDRPIHAWYRFVLSYPPHLVRDYLAKFNLDRNHTVLDPFCGTGTTIVECKKAGIASIGIEANPIAHFASATKVDWRPSQDGLRRHATSVAERALKEFQQQGIEDAWFIPALNGHLPANLRTLPQSQMELLLTDSISPLPLHKTLVLLDALQQTHDDRFSRHEHLALATALVNTISNLHFGPEVGVGPAKQDAPVVPAWLEQAREMCNDLAHFGGNTTPAVALLGDSRHIAEMVEPHSIDAVITSPPYPNEKDYTRTTRLESVLLGLLRDKADLKALKRGLIRSNTRGVTVEDDDDEWIESHPEIKRIADAIEARRIELGKTSGFEKLYARVTKLYFGGILRHLTELRTLLKPDAQLAYVVGDQASYLRVMIRTGNLLGQIAESLGYQVQSIDLFRTRLATATREQLREEVVVLKWSGRNKKSFGIAQGSNMPSNNRYNAIIEQIFFDNYIEGADEVSFTREEITSAAGKLNIKLPKNLGDVIYSFRYRTTLPDPVRAKAPVDHDWIIRPAGQARYKFVAVPAGSTRILPDTLLEKIKVPDATPGLITKYALNDEQALLAKVRYNRLIDIFTGVTCYSLQNHLRTNVPSLGQVETDEIYIGVDKRGAQYIFPVQAKGGNDQISVVQLEQDVAMCADKFPMLICHPIAAQFINTNTIALFRFNMGETGLAKISERHYQLSLPSELTPEDLRRYNEGAP